MIAIDPDGKQHHSANERLCPIGHSKQLMLKLRYALQVRLRH